MKKALEFQAMFYTNENDGIHIDSEYFYESPSDDDIEFIAKSINSSYVELYYDKYKDESYMELSETIFITNN